MPAGENNTMDARILLMLNMVTPEDLVDDQEYGDIYEDVKEECPPYGAVEDLCIPRPIKKDKQRAQFWQSFSSQHHCPQYHHPQSLAAPMAAHGRTPSMVISPRSVGGVIVPKPEDPPDPSLARIGLTPAQAYQGLPSSLV